MEIFWELHQSRRISDTEEAATRMERQAEQVSSTMSRLEERIDKLMLVNMALWSLLKERTHLTEEDLLKRVEEIDLSDGKLDGKVRQQISECPQCHRTITVRHNRCLYCGFTPEHGDFAAFLTHPLPPCEQQPTHETGWKKEG